MLRSLFAGVSGLEAHQTMMDVVGNNIANMDTVGFKAADVTFESTLSQLLQSPAAPQNQRGGTNPAQVGLGVMVGSITTNFSQGAMQSTGVNTDLAIQGDGFFVLQSPSGPLYTRAGAFSFDSAGNLVDSAGNQVMGYQAVNGVINTSNQNALAPITLPTNATVPAVATGNVTLTGTLPTTATTAQAGPPAVPATSEASSITVYDGAGNPVNLTVQMTYQGAGTDSSGKPTYDWSMQVMDGSTNVGSASTVQFLQSSGALDSATPVTLSAAALNTATGSNGFTNGVNLDVSAVTAAGGQSSFTASAQDGYATGNLQSFSINASGTLIGVFSNGLKQNIGQVALATFSNPAGLLAAGNTDFQATVDSGVAQLGTSQTGSRGTIAEGMLEQSNVDLGAEFSNLIIAQRGFEANSRVVTASDQILQDLIQLKQ